MSVAVLLGLGVLGVGCLMLWHPRAEQVLLRYPWWVTAAAPCALLALIALLATGVPPLQGEGVTRTASVLAVVVAVTGGGPVTVALLRGVERSGVPGVSETSSLDQLVDHRGTGEEVLKGGTWIGVLERAAIASSLLVGMGEGVAIVIAVKGLARYPELRVVGASERFIIGTFSSGLWAAAAAGVAALVAT